MMFRRTGLILTAIALFVLLLPKTGFAQQVVQAPDKIGILDKATGKEWLPLNYSTGAYFDQVYPILSVPNQPARPGYKLATDSEVLQLLNDFGFTNALADNGVLAQAFYALFGASIGWSLPDNSPGIVKGDITMSGEAIYILSDQLNVVYSVAQYFPNLLLDYPAHAIFPDGSCFFLVKDAAVTITAANTPTELTSPDHINTFISSDKITLKAQTSPLTDVLWTVTGLSTATGITGFPTNEVHTSDVSGVSTFSFSPEDNAAFVLNRKFLWTLGSNIPNRPIQFDVQATATVNGLTYMDSLAQHSNLGQLTQDPTDTLRQEYQDFGLRFNGTLNGQGQVIDINTPDRVDFVTSLGPPYYFGYYPVQLDQDLEGHYNALLGFYHGMVIQVNGQAVTIPNSATVTIKSGYRNPQYNLAQGSRAVDSHHTHGNALDVGPLTFTAKINGIKQQVSVEKCLYPALYEAASMAGVYAQAEDATSTKIDGYPSNPVWKPKHAHVISHIHFQWGN